MGATATRMTAEQYYAVSVEGDRKQLVDGAIVVHEPKFIHAVLQARMRYALHRWVSQGEDRGLPICPTDITLDDYNVVGPDVIWFAEERPPLSARGYPARVPDLCVEIRSPGTWRYDVGAKKSAYERGGLPELWLVDGLSEVVLIFRRSVPEVSTFDVALELAQNDSLASPWLPEFALALDELFAD